MSTYYNDRAAERQHASTQVATRRFWTLGREHAVPQPYLSTAPKAVQTANQALHAALDTAERFKQERKNAQDSLDRATRDDEAARRDAIAAGKEPSDDLISERRDDLDRAIRNFDAAMQVAADRHREFVEALHTHHAATVDTAKAKLEKARDKVLKRPLGDAKEAAEEYDRELALLTMLQTFDPGAEHLQRWDRLPRTSSVAGEIERAIIAIQVTEADLLARPSGVQVHAERQAKKSERIRRREEKRRRLQEEEAERVRRDQERLKRKNLDGATVVGVVSREDS